MAYYQRLVDAVVKGIKVINKYDDDPYFCTSHDVIYCGKYYLSFNKMSEKDKQILDDLGWKKDDKNDLWCKAF